MSIRSPTHLLLYLSWYLTIGLCVYVSICLSLHLFLSLSLWLFTYLSICPSIYVSIHLSIYLFIFLSVYLSISLSIDRSIYLSIFLSVCLAIWTSKSGPTLRCFIQFDFQMCFAPQRRALFRDLNFQEWSEPLVFLTFWLPNVLRATTACTFSRSELPKVVQEWCAFNILTSKCASRHNGVHFFEIWTSKSGPRMVFFVHFDSNCASRHNGVHFFDISTAKSGPELVCFVHFDFEMCFAPQRRAIFHLSSGQLAPHPPL